MTSVFSESPLLADAEAILVESSFTAKREYISAASALWLLAENEFFVVGVIATRLLEDAQRIEPFAAAELLSRVTDPGVGAKRWDAYVVLLAEEVIDDPQVTRELVELQYDTRGVRRLVATGVTERDLVARALRPFLPLPEPHPGGLSDAFGDLADQLELNGIEQSKARRYVATFAETGALDGV